MPYGSITGDEASQPRYGLGGIMETPNGTAIFSMSLDVEGYDPAFTVETDAAFQDFLDAIHAAGHLTSITDGNKTWRLYRNITPTP